MTDDYRVKALSNQEIHRLAKKARAFFGVAGHGYVDLFECLSKPVICRVRGERQLNFQVRPDAEMGSADGSTIFGSGIVTIAIKKSVRDAAFIGVGRARNTLAHEIGHAVLHDGAPMLRRADGNLTPKWLKPFESAEHQAKVFAPAFLINDDIARTLSTAEEIAIEFGISLESAEIYYKELTEHRERSKNAERVRRLADELASDFRASNPSNAAKFRYLQEIYSVCSYQRVFPIGTKFMCEHCGTVFDRFQDGDLVE